MTDGYAVFGNPVEHSRSPDIHARFARQTGQDLSYGRQRVEPGAFKITADAFFLAGGKGLNITLPFKIDAFHYAQQLTARAQLAGAVNTLALRQDDLVLGDNTDGAGLVRDITANLRWRISGKKLLVLGAGGAVRGVLAPLLAENPAAVVIANRTAEKAHALAGAFAGQGLVEGCGFADLAGRQFDMVINGTSASLAGDLPPLPDNLLAPDACCYDMMYGKDPTIFMRWAGSRHAATADGLGMLVEQAAEAFYLWRGVRPETAPVIAWLRSDV